MANPVSFDRLRPITPPARAAQPQQGAATPQGGGFAALIRQELERVSQMQAEADAKVEQLLTGQTQDLSAVFAATQKAQIAFSLLMEIRNKLIDAYEELKNMRI